jgi:hypothetical protein
VIQTPFREFVMMRSYFWLPDDQFARLYADALGEEERNIASRFWRTIDDHSEKAK